MLQEPQPFAMVPSSMAVTLEPATCWPILPHIWLMPMPTQAASREWPQASWKITPPKPEAMATVILPLGQGMAFRFTRAWRDASAPIFSGVNWGISKTSRPI